MAGALALDGAVGPLQQLPQSQIEVAAAAAAEFGSTLGNAVVNLHKILQLGFFGGRPDGGRGGDYSGCVVGRDADSTR